MPEDMPDRMPNRMSEDMSDRMPEDVPVRTCINVMVGITRSKVIFLLSKREIHHVGNPTGPIGGLWASGPQIQDAQAKDRVQQSAARFQARSGRAHNSGGHRICFSKGLPFQTDKAFAKGK